MSRPRVALLYSGLPRMWRECHATHLALFPDAEVDVFCHFWDTIDAAEKQELLAALRPVAWRFDPPQDFSFVDRYPHIQRDNINVPSRLISQYTSWRHVGTLFAPHAPRYRLAMRSRTDVNFFAPIPYDLSNVVNGEIGLVAWHWTEDQRMLSDIAAIGAPRQILYWHDLLDRIWELSASAPFNCEQLLTKHILSFPGKTKIYLMKDWPFFVRRPHMAGWPVERCLGQSPGASKWHDPEIVAAHKAFHRSVAGEAGEAHVERFRAAMLRSGGSGGA